MEEKLPPKSTLQDSVMQSIDTQKTRPRSKWSFRFSEYLVWLAWLASVVLGAVAVAVSTFVMQYWQYSLYEATHDNFLTLFVDSLPVLWFLLFAVMVTASLYNLRRTNTGYRHSLGKLVFSSIALSLLIGWGLNSAGFGYTVDNLLGKNVDMYLSQDEIEWQLWQAPESGRLLGAEIGVENDLVIFQDVLNMPWLMDVNELHLEDLQALGTGETMHIIGVMTGEQTFTACGVLEWRYDSAATISQLQAEKERFAERIYSHFSMGEKAESGSICAEAAMVRRMEKVLH